jgi:hypothetical protein
MDLPESTYHSLRGVPIPRGADRYPAKGHIVNLIKTLSEFMYQVPWIPRQVTEGCKN